MYTVFVQYFGIRGYSEQEIELPTYEDCLKAVKAYQQYTNVLAVTISTPRW